MQYLDPWAEIETFTPTYMDLTPAISFNKRSAK